MKREVKLGVFIFIGILILVTFILVVGDVEGIFKKPGYSILVQFDSAAGLEKGTTVRLAGVKVGHVHDIQLKGNRAQVELKIKKGVKIQKEARATLASLGFLGEKYVEIMPGEKKDYYQPGDLIQGVPPVSFDQLGTLMFSIGEEVKQMGKTLREFVGGEETRTDFRETIDNMASLSAEMEDFFQANKQEVRKTLRNSTQAFQKLDQSLEKASQDIQEMAGLIKEMAEENRESLKTNLSRMKKLMEEAEKSLGLLQGALRKIEEKEGTLGKMIHQPELYQKAEAAVDDLKQTVHSFSNLSWEVGVRGDYMAGSGALRSTLSLKMFPSENHYLMTQIIRDPWLDRFLYSAQAGARWGPLSPRFGIMESKIGVGVDWFVWENRLKLSLEGFDFNREPRPRLRLWASYAPSPGLRMIMGIEDFTLAPKRELFLGLGFGF